MKRHIRIVKSSAHIDRILKKGVKVYGNAFVLFYLPAPIDGIEFAAIAGKRVFKRAVDRNFAKRRIRELMGATYRDLNGSLRKLGSASKAPEDLGVQIILMAKKPIQTSKYCDLLAEVKNIISRSC